MQESVAVHHSLQEAAQDLDAAIAKLLAADTVLSQAEAAFRAVPVWVSKPAAPWPRSLAASKIPLPVRPPTDAIGPLGLEELFSQLNPMMSFCRSLLEPIERWTIAMETNPHE